MENGLVFLPHLKKNPSSARLEVRRKGSGLPRKPRCVCLDAWQFLGLSTQRSAHESHEYDLSESVAESFHEVTIYDEELFVIFDTHGNTGRNPIC